MVQGFETRDSTDIPVRALVESANGHMWKKEKAVDQYEQTIWPGFDNNFDRTAEPSGCYSWYKDSTEELFMFFNNHTDRSIKCAKTDFLKCVQKPLKKYAFN